jgi:peptidoglycan hydrolase-like protein with peptidoglycan-binding domain
LQVYILLTSVLLLFPYPSAALSLEEISAQIRNISVQLEALQAQAITAWPVSGSDAIQNAFSTEPTDTGLNALNQCIIARTLARGAKGDDVKCLQQSLIQQSFLAPGLVTGYFGDATRRAVERFQVAKKIVPTEARASAGLGQVGPLTRQALILNPLYFEPYLYNPDEPILSAITQFAFAIPSQMPPVGTLELSRQAIVAAPQVANVQATLTVIPDKCTGWYPYTLDWGDGSKIVSDPGKSGEKTPYLLCFQAPVAKSHTHAYKENGDYWIRFTTATTSTATKFSLPLKPTGGINFNPFDPTIAVLSANPYEAISSRLVEFSAYPDGGAVTREIKFGDGKKGTMYAASCLWQSETGCGNAPAFRTVHEYKTPGTYTATIEWDNIQASSTVIVR